MEQSFKKAWSTPVVETLDVQETLGGIIRRNSETLVFELTTGGVTFGTIPAP